MRNARVLAIAIVSSILVSLVAAASAFATAHELEWEVGGIKTFGSKGITVVSNTTQELESNGITIKCSGISVSGSLVAGTPGKDKETITYSGCKVFEGATEKPNCTAHSSGKANGEIETAALESKIYYKNKTAGEAGTASESDTLFKPEMGSTFASVISPNNTECPSGLRGTTAVTGEVALENTDSPTTPQHQHKLKGFAVSPTKWCTGAVPSVCTNVTLTAFGASGAKYKGEVELETTAPVENWNVV